MALIIDATPSGQNSNSYITLDNANTYFDSRLYVTAWTDATDDLKNRSLVMATRRIDNEKFYGSRAVNNQSLAWGRIGLDDLDGVNINNIIPYQIKEATCELALYMLATDMSKAQENNGAVKRVKVGSVEKEYHYEAGQAVVQKSYNELPDFVASLLSDLSVTVSNGGAGQINVSR
ncbi:MAG: hypothetical protein JJV88_00540 [Sulfurovum sp.]|nr:hypothetical protein [Sulfurovaceae bacterium]